jgi:CRISPR/Cas system-associated exonuclease Cas4 (RecB family)
MPIRYPLVTGVAFHELVNDMYKICDFELDFLVKNWKSQFLAKLENEACGFSSTKDYEPHLNYGYGLIKKFHKFAKEQGYLIPPIKSEWAYEFKFGSAKLVGKVDLVIQRKNMPFVEILDFKTGYNVAPQKSVDTNRQLTIYDWAVKKQLKIQNTKVGLFYPRYDKILLSERTPDDYKNMLIGFNDLYKSIIKKEFDPNYLHCSMCEFTEYCDFYKNNFSKVPENVI